MSLHEGELWEIIWLKFRRRDDQREGIAFSVGERINSVIRSLDKKIRVYDLWVKESPRELARITSD